MKILPLLIVNKKRFLFNIIELKRINQKLGNVIRFLQIIVFLKKSHLNKLKYIHIYFSGENRNEGKQRKRNKKTTIMKKKKERKEERKEKKKEISNPDLLRSR